MKKRSITAAAIIALVALSGDCVRAEQKNVEKPQPGSPYTPESSLGEPQYGRFSSVPTDKRLKNIYDDLVQFRSDLALRHLAPIVSARAKRGLKRPQDQLSMGRLMELVGYSYVVDENYKAALNSLIIAQKICPGDVHIKCMLANLYRDVPDFDAEDRLIAELNKVPERDRFPYFYFTLARNAKRNGDLVRVTEYLDKAEALDVERRQSAIQSFYGRMLVLSGLNTAAVDRFKKAADRTENQYLREIILSNAAQIEFDEAAQEAHLRAASKIYPFDPIWRLKLSELYLQRGNEAKGLPLLEEAFQCKRFSRSAYFKLARHYIARGKFEKALDVVQHLEGWSRVSADTLILKGEIEAGRKNKRKAEEYYTQALKISPKNVELYEILIQFYRATPDRVQDAVKVSADFVKFLPEFWPAHYCRAQALLAAKQLVPAQREAAKALEQLSVYPARDLNVYALHRAGVAHAIVGTKFFVEDNDLERAIEEAKAFNQMKFNPDLPAYLKMVSLRPERIKFNDALGLKDPMIHVAIADMLLESNYIDQCVAEYKKAQELAPDDQSVRSYLIHALSQKGDWAGTASENFAFSRTLVNQIPGAIDELRTGKKKKSETRIPDSGNETKSSSPKPTDSEDRRSGN